MVKTLFLVLFAVTSFAQESMDLSERFRQAVFLYTNRQYEPASKIFSDLEKDNSFIYQVPSGIFLAKILLEQGRNDEAESKFKELEAKAEDDYYQREILLGKSIALYNKGMHYEAADELIKLIQTAGGTQYQRYAESVLDTLVVFNLNPDEVTVLYNLAGSDTKPFLLLLLGKTYLAAGNNSAARNTFQRLIKEFPSSEYKKEAEDYYQNRKTIKIPEPGEPVIVLLFSEESGPAGRAIHQITEGIKYAVHEFNSGREDKVGIVHLNMDQGRVKEIRNSILGMNAKCVIGPVFSDDVRLVLSEFRGIKLPLISPTATDNNLTSLNEYFFQANPNFTYRGKAMAQYVYYVENKRSMGVINAIEGYSPLLAFEFMQEFRKLGGEIVLSRTYRSRSGVVDETLKDFLPVMENIEGIYVPVSDKDDIPTLLNALVKYNVSVPLYGNQDWFLGKGYETYPLLMNNLVFTSDYFIDFSSYSYNEFNEKFISTTGLEAERNALYGYDLAKYFLNQMTKINAGPDMIAARMVNGNTVTGFHNNISFDDERVNRFINIVRYRNGFFELVDKFRTAAN
jgi:ABC-type branched-subunit amino acid transport system substrate-binding protein